MLKIISLGRGPTICDNEGTVSAFVVLSEETVTFVVFTAKETMMTTIYLKSEVQSVRQEMC